MLDKLKVKLKNHPPCVQIECAPGSQLYIFMVTADEAFRLFGTPLLLFTILRSMGWSVLD
jgi:hypothetical protein